MEEGRTGRAAAEGDPLVVAAQRMDLLARLAPGIAHELANPFAAIMAFSALIGTDPRLPADVRDDAASVRREGELAHARTRALLDFVRHRSPERHPTRAGPLIQGALDLVSYPLTSRSVRVDTSFDESLPPVPMDRALLQQAVLNLLLNGLDALEAQGGGRISIRAELGEGHGTARFVVEDDGPGVDAELADQIFEPGVTTRPERAGLGLAVVRAIAGDHGGSVTHGPGTDGRGAVFVVQLPLSTPAAPAEDTSSEADRRPATTAPSPPTPRPTVLVVDDEAPLRRFLARALDGIGVGVVEAASGGDAIRAVGAAGNGPAVDLVLTDLRMPGSDGMAVYESIVAAHPELGGRFVLMSGDVHDPALRAFAEARGIRLLSKPFDLAEIRATVRSLLEEG